MIMMDNRSFFKFVTIFLGEQFIRYTGMFFNRHPGRPGIAEW